MCVFHSQVCADTPYTTDTLLMAKIGGETLGVHTTAFPSKARCATKSTMRFAEPGPHAGISKGAAALVARANFFRKISEDLNRRLRDATIQSPTSAICILLSQKLHPKTFDAIFGPLWQRIALRDCGSAGEKNTAGGKRGEPLANVLSLLSADNKPFTMSASWEDVMKGIFSTRGGVGVESEIKRLHMLQVASDGNDEPMCGDILIKSSRMGHRPKPREMKAVWMNRTAPPSKAGVPAGTQHREPVLLEKEHAQELVKGKQRAGESGKEAGNGDEASDAGVQGAEVGQGHSSEAGNKSEQKSKSAGKTATRAGNRAVPNSLVLSEVQGLEVEYAVLQVRSLYTHPRPHPTTHSPSFSPTQPLHRPSHSPASASILARARTCEHRVDQSGSAQSAVAVDRLEKLRF